MKNFPQSSETPSSGEVLARRMELLFSRYPNKQKTRLAEKLGAQKNRVTKLLSREYKLLATEVIEICEFFEVPVDWFLDVNASDEPPKKKGEPRTADEITLDNLINRLVLKHGMRDAVEMIASLFGGRAGDQIRTGADARGHEPARTPEATKEGRDGTRSGNRKTS